MRRSYYILTACLVISMLAACTANGPEITAAAQSDNFPVSGQKIVLQIKSITDNPPMTYTWNYDSTTMLLQDYYGNVIAPGTATNSFMVYWTAPDSSGTYTVTMTVNDDSGKSESIDFLLTVGQRTIQCLMDAKPAAAQILSYDKNSILSGMFAAVSGDTGIAYPNAPNNIKIFSSTAYKSEMDWGNGLNLTAFFPVYSSSSYLANIWGGIATSDTATVIFHPYGSTDIPYSKSSSNDRVNDIEVIGGNIWVSANSGFCSISNNQSTWNSPLINCQSFGSDFSTGLAAVATTLGVYYSTTTDYIFSQLPGPGQDYTLSVVTLANPLNIFTLVDINGSNSLIQYSKSSDGMTWTSTGIDWPGDYTDYDSVSKISKDSNGRIWAGRQRYNPSPKPGEIPWYNPDPGPQNTIHDSVDYSMVSPEGLVYFRTTTGQLWVWGKTPTPTPTPSPY